MYLLLRDTADPDFYQYSDSLVLHLEATSGTYKTVVSGGVSSWRNKVGSGDWAQSTAGLRPIDNNSLLGSSYGMGFNGDVLVNASPLAIADDFTIFFVLNTPVSGVLNILLASTGTNKLGLVSNAPAAVLGGAPLISGAAVSASKTVVCFSRDVANTTNIYINNALRGTGNAGSDPLTITYIGGVDATPAEAYVGEIAEIVAYSSALSTLNIQNVVNDLRAKYSI